MIQETWWELILKYNAEIIFKYKDKEKKVEISEPLKALLQKKTNKVIGEFMKKKKSL